MTPIAKKVSSFILKISHNSADKPSMEGDEKRVILGSYLFEDERIHDEAALKKRIFSNEMYEIKIYVFKGHQKTAKFRTDLVAALIDFKEEDVMLLVKLATYPHVNDPQTLVERVVAEMEHQGKTPFTMIRDAKKWCKVPLTEHDFAFLSNAGVLNRNAA